jgi:biopolymer transport protein ExbD
MKRKNKSEKAGLDMTPMIDVVFQLLIFFIVTMKPDDILSHLDILRPQPNERRVEEIAQATVTVSQDGYVFQGKRVSLNELKAQLIHIGSMNRDATVNIQCTDGSAHNGLVAVLDACARAELRKISVFSLGGPGLVQNRVTDSR